MPIIHDPMQVPARTGTIYPAPFNEGYEHRHKRKLTELLGLTQFGANITTLRPGGKSAERHWHQHEDELVYIISGTPTLIDDNGRALLAPGMMLGFPANEPNGHHIVNESDADATILEIGTRAANESATYSDIDLLASADNGTYSFRHKDGTPYDT